MSEEKKVQISINADPSNAIRNLATFSNSIKSTFSNAINIINKTIDSFGFLGTTISALQTGLILKKIFDINEYARLEKSLMLIQANYSGNADQVRYLRAELNKLAGEEGEALEKLYTLSAKYSNIYSEKDIIKIMKASALVADAMNQDIAITSDRIVQLMKLYKKGPEEVIDIANALIASRSDLESLSIIFQRGIIKGGSADDYKNILSFIGGLNRAGIDAGRIINQFQGSISLLFEKSSKLKALGVDIYKIDPQTKNKIRKNHIELLEDIENILKTKYKNLSREQLVAGLDRTFGEGIGESILFLISQLDNLKMAQKDMQNASSIAQEKAKAASNTLEEQWNRLKGIIGSIKTDWQFIYDKIRDSLKFLADRPELTKDITYSVAGLSILAGGWVIGRKGWNIIKSMGGTVAGVAEGKLLEKTAGVTPVFVTNWPSGFGTKEAESIISSAKTILPTIATGYKTIGVAGSATLAAMGGTLAYFSYRGSQVLGYMKEMGSLQDFIAGSKSEKSVQYREQFINALKNNSEFPELNKKIENIIPINITIDSSGKIIAQSPSDAKVSISKRGDFFPTEEYSF